MTIPEGLSKDVYAFALEMEEMLFSLESAQYPKPEKSLCNLQLSIVYTLRNMAEASVADDPLAVRSTAAALGVHAMRIAKQYGELTA